jgi:hypothetical protein
MQSFTLFLQFFHQKFQFVYIFSAALYTQLLQLSKVFLYRRALVLYSEDCLARKY